MKTHRELLVEFQRVAIPGSQADEVMQHISEQLHTELVRYNWGGSTYWMEPIRTTCCWDRIREP